MFSGMPPAYSSGLMKFVAWGEKTTRPATISLLWSVRRTVGGQWEASGLTGLRKIESFFQQKRNKAKDRDEATEDGANNIKISHH